jgi:hypothetical protein
MRDGTRQIERERKGDAHTHKELTCGQTKQKEAKKPHAAHITIAFTF